MKALITGIKGAAGSYLKEYLESKGQIVCGISRDTCDMRKLEPVIAALDAERPDTIYHLAADASVDESYSQPQHYANNNIAATINLFEALRKLRINPLVMVGSTSEVYGDNPRTPTAEDAPLNPTNPYGCSKLAKDVIAQMYGRHYGMRVVITRGFSYINPRRMDLSLTAFANQIARIEAGEPIQLRHGNLDSVRAFCDVRDVVRAFAMVDQVPIVSKRDPLDGIYNIGGGWPISIGACLEILISLSPAKIVTTRDRTKLRQTDVSTQVADSRRFHAITSWLPQYHLVDSLKWLLGCQRERLLSEQTAQTR